MLHTPRVVIRENRLCVYGKTPLVRDHSLTKFYIELCLNDEERRRIGRLGNPQHSEKVLEPEPLNLGYLGQRQGR